VSLDNWATQKVPLWDDTSKVLKAAQWEHKTGPAKTVVQLKAGRWGALKRTKRGESDLRMEKLLQAVQAV
jgi:hypothetical protein